MGRICQIRISSERFGHSGGAVIDNHTSAFRELSKRARVIVYNRAAGMPEPLATYADLANPAHQGKVCIRSSSNIYNISLMASIVARDGEAAAEEWAAGVVANFARTPQSNDTGQIRAVASGECGIAIANTYYLARLAASADAANLAR